MSIKSGCSLSGLSFEDYSFNLRFKFLTSASTCYVFLGGAARPNFLGGGGNGAAGFD